MRDSDAGGDTVSALVPIMSELCQVLDEHDPVTIARAETRAIEILGAERSFALTAEEG